MHISDDLVHNMEIKHKIEDSFKQTELSQFIVCFKKAVYDYYKTHLLNIIMNIELLRIKCLF